LSNALRGHLAEAWHRVGQGPQWHDGATQDHQSLRGILQFTIATSLARGPRVLVSLNFQTSRASRRSGGFP
jgi:hypothetical protein